MKKYLVSLLALTFVLCGCHDTYKWSEFEDLDASVEGIQLSQTGGSNISTDGCNFSVTSNDPHCLNGCILVHTFKPDSTCTTDTYNLYTLRLTPQLTTSAGTITLTSNSSPYRFSVSINSLSSHPRRYVDIIFGGGYKTKRIFLRQTAQ